MTYQRVRYVDWTNRVLFILFAIALFTGLPGSGSVTLWLIWLGVFPLVWWAGGRIETLRIANATKSWRLAHYPNETSPSFLRFVDSLGGDLGGHVDNLTPATPLAELDWVTLQAKVQMDITHPCKRWVDFLLDHADITGIDTDNLGDKTLEDLIDLILVADKA